ncbi:discoidin domain-containing protein [Acetobacter oeni]|uniref:Uncharacterized protein n=1 Tax=Acetobacter oeni TaxID=304077 RepID=A0A511XH17_9PROT|nr:discoidin domain-containing protein [Acetobacter oeni]MBB3882378.1 hypothetical protein [Acetobacter oeni]NHO18521.1 hypothetical protein [Acetobacter oeni]GBR00399.1 hypothetical protein AA21952_0083 [Acetobacter oeni LMG 21952]GEN62237.1 hypothetical protein AOE01nite_04610 [Acetobacter oeni]
MSVIIGFRTHIWNDDIEYIARRLKGAFSKADFVILADETHQTLDTGSLPKITHTADFSEFGLPSVPDWNVLWHNGDYPLYVLRRAFPDITHYLMVENDVLVNFDLDVLLDYIQKNNIDLVVHQIEKTSSEWGGYASIAEYFSNPMKCLFPFIAISGRAIDVLYKNRINHARMFLEKKTSQWPYCEGFIASSIMEDENLSVKDISEFCDPEHYSFNGCYHYLDREANIHGTICHPVRGIGFVQRRLDEDGPDIIFDRNSVLRRGLSNLKPRDFYNTLYRAVVGTKRIDKVNQFNDIALQEGWIMKPESINRALGAKSSQSSVCQYSRVQDVCLDAEGAVSGVPGKDHFFHTDLEFSPWWKAELYQSVNIKHIIIYNRSIHKERASKIHVEISENDQDWVTVASYPNGIIFDGIGGVPLVICVNSIMARFIKISLLDENFLHLSQVEVYDQ